MGWTDSAPALPSGSGYSSETKLTCDLYHFGYRAYVSIARMTNNQVSIRVRLDQVYGTGGSSQEKPPNYWHLVAGSDTTNGRSWKDRTVYWTGTLNAGSTITVQVSGWTGSDVSSGSLRSTKLTGPAYISKYTVSYNGNGGSGSVASQTFTYGGSVTIANNGFTRPGYTFTGWSDGWMPGNTYAQAANITLYAQWTAVTYSVAYDANGGSGAPASQTKSQNVALTLSSTVPTRTGYTFLGWATDSAATVAEYQPGGSYEANSSVTLYAVWKKNNIPVYVKPDGNIHQVEKAYVKVNGEVKVCRVYTKINGVVKELS